MSPSLFIADRSELLQPLPHSKLDTTLGAVFVADVLVALLTGVTAMQTISYYRSKNEDSIYLKLTIGVLWLLDIAQLMLVTFSVYHYAVSNFGDAKMLQHVPWSLSFEVTVSGLSDLLVSCVLLHRIWKFSTSRCISNAMVVCAALLCLATLAGDISITTLTLLPSTTYAVFHQRYGWIWYATFGARAAADAAITAWTCIFLHKSQNKIQRTRNIIRSLIKYSANTCAITTVFVIATIITYAAFPNTFIAFGASIVLPKLMLNSLLAMLNSRERMRDNFNKTSNTSLGDPSFTMVIPRPSTSLGHGGASVENAVSWDACPVPARLTPTPLRQNPSSVSVQLAPPPHTSMAHPRPNTPFVATPLTHPSAVSLTDSQAHLTASPSQQPGACFFDMS